MNGAVSQISKIVRWGQYRAPSTAAILTAKLNTSETSQLSKSSKATEIRLLVEHPSGVWSVLTVPESPSALVASGGAASLVAPTAQNADAGVFLEVMAARPPRLLAFSRARRLHVNGLPAPLLTLLNARDVFRMEPGDLVYHVTHFNRVIVEPANSRQIGAECPVCRGTLTDKSRVLTCCQCGCGIHLEDDATDLQCALAIKSCPACSREIHLKDTYSYLPEGFSLPEEVAA